MAEIDELRNEINGIDSEMYSLFIKRMGAVSKIAEIKSQSDLPVYDFAREEEIFQKAIEDYSGSDLLPFYLDFLRNELRISKEYQSDLMGKAGIIIEKGSLDHIGKYFDLNRKVLIVTDSKVPSEYSLKAASQCRDSVIYTVPFGEENKNLDTFEKILSFMAESGFCRSDAVIAVGGGMVCDIAGFVSSVYMRGIDFYSIPTTVLADVDASVGGKTAVNLGKYKNTVGTFNGAKCVLIDTKLLETLDERQYSNGLAEAVKTGLIADPSLFDIICSGNIKENIDLIVTLSVDAKKKITNLDPFESGLRRILNFGHTVGHAVESYGGFKKYLHGEAVAIGMLPMCDESVRKKLIPVLSSLCLPVSFDGNIDELFELIKRDKKNYNGLIRTVYCPEIGQYEIREMTCDEIISLCREVYK